MKVIIFVFAGRRPNMELQLPFVRRILAEHPEACYDVWNLARDRADGRYLQTIEGERITVHNEYREHSPGYDRVYRHYADPRYRDAVFVKLDDDIVFLETDRFGAFVDAITAHPEAVISANIVNNGACTPLDAELWERFSRMAIPLSDVHTFAGFAALAHTWFFEHYPAMMAAPSELVCSDNWLSINVIGYHWAMGTRIAGMVGAQVGTKACPQVVAGRALTFLGDEGMVNTLPRMILRGFVAAHLTYGPQRLPEAQLGPWRSHYAEIGAHYLDATAAGYDAELPEFHRRDRVRVPAGENNPCAGRFTP